MLGLTFGWNDHNLVYPGYLTDSATANVTGNNNLAANPFILDCVNGADMPLGTCGTPKDGRVHDFLSNSYTNKIQLNGHDRFAPRPGNYFRCVQPYQHHSRFLKVKFIITVSVLDQKNINQVVHVIFQELIMLNYNIHCNL